MKTERQALETKNLREWADAAQEVSFEEVSRILDALAAEKEKSEAEQIADELLEMFGGQP